MHKSEEFGFERVSDTYMGSKTSVTWSEPERKMYGWSNDGELMVIVTEEGIRLCGQSLCYENVDDLINVLKNAQETFNAIKRKEVS